VPSSRLRIRKITLRHDSPPLSGLLQPGSDYSIHPTQYQHPPKAPPKAPPTNQQLTIAVRVPGRLLERRRHQQARRLRPAHLVRPAAEEALVRADVQRAGERLGGGDVKHGEAVGVGPGCDLDGHVFGAEGDRAVVGVVAVGEERRVVTGRER